MRGVCLVALAASLVGAPSAVAAQQQKPPSPLPAEIVAAWEKAGAQAGWLGTTEKFGRSGFRVGGEGNAGEVPAFRFRKIEQGVLGRLLQPDCGFGISLAYRDVTDVGLKELAGMKSLQTLVLGGGTKGTDAGLKELTGLKSLETLVLQGIRVTDVGLKELAGLKSLQTLYLGGTRVTDVGLKELAGLKSLQTLDLSGTQVTDVGLKELAGLKSLQTLYLSPTYVTEAGVTELQNALPWVDIHR